MLYYTTKCVRCEEDIKAAFDFHFSTEITDLYQKTSSSDIEQVTVFCKHCLKENKVALAAEVKINPIPEIQEV